MVRDSAAFEASEPTLSSTTSMVGARKWGLVIDGKITGALEGQEFENFSPVTGAMICQLPDARERDVEAAVASAAKAQVDWGRMPVKERSSIVRKLATVLREHRKELAALDAIDVGNVYSFMLADVDAAADTLEMMANFGLSLTGRTYPVADTHLCYSRYEPYGVVARINAFNHPVLFAGQKIGAPLVAGNALIMKPSENAALSALRMGELFAEHLPPGLLNVIVGKGAECPQAIVRHPAVKRIGFIGSSQVGMAIQRDAAAVAVKNITLELGGKNALIVAPDADFEAAAVGVVKGMNFVGWQSQSCMSTTRAIVPRSEQERFASLVKAEVESIVIGDPFEPTTRMGTLASQAQFEKTRMYVDIAKSEGAELVTGGEPHTGCGPGLYHKPTVFTNVRPESRLAREEVFGPVLSIIGYDTLDEAVQIANSVTFGLTGSVWSRDIGTAHRLAHALQAGYVWINDSSSQFEGVPFGGYKNSGIGHEDGLEELFSYAQLKALNVRIGG
ncbi:MULTISPECIES: aldehyde dehydrogenase family protein [unclassified Mesorhizobium]|uniref:aldehyde dehydrogenase family protein n=1 Tax=unclassified Mesorhizobium TaxID=325217 RepID=UPI0010924FE8|nr:MULTISPECIES: aldehyde dehydrogenase family protein [unclassified Mesorhizobium]TGV15137.1 aldehyde dehydrogenase family protein [Mesorhizobium sp. M8A.F.Ca.ET.173.01.1.1]TGQ77274.1 aldehyde dehydrogenase family protein [Mesorhizobium sp. M8A.F.Ca.ET.207.01.1.1]TGS39027.1 aldehyde dehydrogenase family protein [Mesorhizobium sp. M8A.F.Ca.ET.182.01.1.1]TGS77308.1 aldehyde dehydrogenase family protein [Mesorhizobium sp. M8A.F.Ca.ET.181.01.1.1]TGT36310.1 aldehyde dehydrogenase family protein [M